MNNHPSLEGPAHRKTASLTTLRIWLGSVIFLIFAMVVVGGITRLTGSGLSMVEWRPLMGILPPLSEPAWQSTFEKYQAFPEYRHHNAEMTLSEFKFIFWWEYIHRLLGRAIGIVFLGPFLYFWLARRFPPGMASKLIIAFILGGLQGFLGWYMVRSGLVDVPRVSHYRLAAHLTLALFLMAYLFWLFLDLLPPPKPLRLGPGLHVLLVVLGLLVGVQIIYGAFTAGLHAGLVVRTFPRMNGLWIPNGIGAMDPVWRNGLENPVTVHFIHRTLGWVLLSGTLAFWYIVARWYPHARLRAAAHSWIAAVTAQFFLGVFTVLHAVPISLASLHQAGACLVLLVLVWTIHTAIRAPKNVVET